jgi:hypothetical protein
MQAIRTLIASDIEVFLVSFRQLNQTGNTLGNSDLNNVKLFHILKRL